MKKSIALLWLAVGCEAADPSLSGERAWVMVDEAAAREGWRVRHADWTDAPRLPTEIDPAQPAIAAGPHDQRIELGVSDGVVAHVMAGGEIERLELGIDAPMDRLIARGDPEAVGELADLLGAALTERDGEFVLAADGLFEATSFLEVPEGVEEVTLDRGPRSSRSAAAVTGFAMVGEDGERAAMLVGMYQHGAGVVVLDAEGGFNWTTGCWGGMRTGRVVIEDQRIVLVGDDGRADAFAVDAQHRLIGEEITLTSIGDQR